MVRLCECPLWVEAYFAFNPDGVARTMSRQFLTSCGGSEEHLSCDVSWEEAFDAQFVCSYVLRRAECSNDREQRDAHTFLLDFERQHRNQSCILSGPQSFGILILAEVQQDLLHVVTPKGFRLALRTVPEERSDRRPVRHVRLDPVWVEEQAHQIALGPAYALPQIGAEHGANHLERLVRETNVPSTVYGDGWERFVVRQHHLYRAHDLVHLRVIKRARTKDRGKASCGQPFVSFAQRHLQRLAQLQDHAPAGLSA